MTSATRLQPASLSVSLLWTAAAAFFAASFFFLTPGPRLFAGTVGLLWLVKTTVLLRIPAAERHRLSFAGLFLYMTVWPGIDPTPFGERVPARSGTLAALLQGVPAFLAGVFVGGAALLLFPAHPAIAEWLALASLLLMIHFGVSGILAALMRLAGWGVAPLFNAPFKSRTLQDFWGRRWNLAFVEMDKLLILPWLKARVSTPWAVFGVFLISGLLHEMALSYPAGAGWGLPTLYFLMHGVLVLLEKRFLKPEKNWPDFVSRAWAAAWVLLPLPLLFHAPFRAVFLGRLLGYARSLWIQ